LETQQMRFDVTVNLSGVEKLKSAHESAQTLFHGNTRNGTLLVSVPLGVVTVT
jgi:hypothetical protein